MWAFRLSRFSQPITYYDSNERSCVPNTRKPVLPFPYRPIYTVSVGHPIKRILVADDHESILRALRVMLEAHPGWEVCGEAVRERGLMTCRNRISQSKIHSIYRVQHDLHSDEAIIKAICRGLRALSGIYLLDTKEGVRLPDHRRSVRWARSGSASGRTQT
jgi:hypothetical protein